MSATPILSTTQYVEAKGCKCPYCGSYHLSARSVDIEGATASQVVDCMNCHESWTDHYKLVGYTPNE